jgi:hypothetical protein
LRMAPMNNRFWPIGFALIWWTPRMRRGGAGRCSDDETEALQALQRRVQARGDAEGERRSCRAEKLSCGSQRPSISME